MSQTLITISVGCGLRKDGSPIAPHERSSMLMRAKMFLLTNCGGYSIATVDGGWRDESGKDWEEPSFEIKIIVPTGQILPEILAATLRDIFCQTCVMFCVEPISASYV